jgi:hypothetical protein
MKFTYGFTAAQESALSQTGEARNALIVVL